MTTAATTVAIEPVMPPSACRERWRERNRALHPGSQPGTGAAHETFNDFPEPERVEVLRHAASFLVPGGKLLLTTLCPGGSPTGAMLHLWGQMTEGCGGLPEPEGLCAQMREAGLEATKFRNVGAPLERFFSFVGTRV